MKARSQARERRRLSYLGRAGVRPHFLLPGWRSHAPTARAGGQDSGPIALLHRAVMLKGLRPRDPSHLLTPSPPANDWCQFLGRTAEGSYRRRADSSYARTVKPPAATATANASSSRWRPKPGASGRRTVPWSMAYADVSIPGVSHSSHSTMARVEAAGAR
jgi:hypothetical protein